MTRKNLLLTVAIAGWACADQESAPTPAATGGPSTDIFVGTLATTPDGYVVSDLRNATNRAGYDNQPHFTPDGTALLYTSQRDGQTDIYRADLESGETRQLTATPESEYSATFTPDGESFSVIRVEADSAQKLWRFSNRGIAVERVFEELAPVGYHAWSGPTAVAMFILPVDSQGITLRLGNPQTQEHQIITNNIGRSLNNIPGRSGISFVDKSSEPWTIHELDPATGVTRLIAETLEGSEDHAWAPDGGILMGTGSELHAWREGRGWFLVADLSGNGLGEISRLAVSRDGSRIAIVSSQ